MADCKDGNCDINPYDKLEKDIYHILNPEVPREQRNPSGWAYASSRKRVDEIMVEVKKFILKRLADDVRYKEMMEE